MDMEPKFITQSLFRQYINVSSFKTKGQNISKVQATSFILYRLIIIRRYSKYHYIHKDIFCRCEYNAYLLSSLYKGSQFGKLQFDTLIGEIKSKVEKIHYYKTGRGKDYSQRVTLLIKISDWW